ncbi:DUF4433 domain-containing protein [soil metagenome]
MIDVRVQQACIARGITRVCHFTQARNLPAILTDPRGIRSAADLAADAPDVLNRNDPLRLDGKPAHICCSIEYPNTWNFRQFRDRERFFQDWVVLVVDPSVLWHTSTYFSSCNAAAATAQHVQGVAGFETLFAPAVRGSRGRTFERTPEMPACCPTNDQAEGLVEGNIARSLIRAIAVATDTQAEQERARLRLVPGVPELTWIVAPSFFTGDWSRLIRKGLRPPERVFTGSL